MTDDYQNFDAYEEEEDLLDVFESYTRSGSASRTKKRVVASALRRGLSGGCLGQYQARNST